MALEAGASRVYAVDDSWMLGVARTVVRANGADDRITTIRAHSLHVALETWEGFVFLNLARYDRRRIDGIWMNNSDVTAIIQKLLAMSYQQRASNNCFLHYRPLLETTLLREETYKIVSLL